MTLELKMLAWTLVLAFVQILLFDIARTGQYGLKWNTGPRDEVMPPLSARAERLQSYNYLLNDPGYLTEDLRRYRAVDAAAIQRAAQEVLNKDGRVVVTIDPNPDAPIMGRVKK